MACSQTIQVFFSRYINHCSLLRVVLHYFQKVGELEESVEKLEGKVKDTTEKLEEKEKDVQTQDQRVVSLY